MNKLLDDYEGMVLDLDGTLLTSSKQISTNTYSALKEYRDSGKMIFFASGRSPQNISNFSRLFNQNAFVAFNGASIKTVSNQEISYKINRNILLELITTLESLSLEYLIYSTKTIFLKEQTTLNRRWIENPVFFKNLGCSIEFIKESTTFLDLKLFYPKLVKENDILKLVVLPSNREAFDLFYGSYRLLKSISMNRTSRYIEITSPVIDKAAAVSVMVKDIGISLKDLICIGDNENDLTMIGKAGLGISMENGTENIKKAARLQIDSNDNDGIAKFIWG